MNVNQLNYSQEILNIGCVYTTFLYLQPYMNTYIYMYAHA